MKGICVNFLDQVQFFRFLKGRWHGNQFCVVPDLFAQSRSISGSAGPIFTIFAGIEWQMIIPTFFSDILRDVAVATNLVAKIRQNYLPPALISLSFRHGMGYQSLNERVNTVNDASKSC